MFPARALILESLLWGRYLGLLRRASYTQSLQIVGCASFGQRELDVFLSLALQNGLLKPTAG